MILSALPLVFFSSETKLGILYSSDWGSYGILQRIIYGIGLFPPLLFLFGWNLIELAERIKYFTEEEKIYLDSNLTLRSFTEKLKVSVHQLSEFINVKYDTNFSGFINRFRIFEAQKMLLDSPHLTILRIAYDVGFESKSTFNEVFLKVSGKSPSDYRKFEPDSSRIKKLN
jgi:AraC-like DNA-binding protein